MTDIEQWQGNIVRGFRWQAEQRFSNQTIQLAFRLEFIGVIECDDESALGTLMS